MTKPIIWALGITAVCAVWGVGLADRFERRQPAPPVPVALAVAQTAPPTSFSPTTLVLEADARGHFNTEAIIDGSRLPMLVDTGATLCAFSQEDAERIGIRVNERDFTEKTRTANGVVAVAPVRIREIRIGTISVRDVEAVVVPRGRLGTSLLGMSFLRRLSDVNMARGRLTVRG